MSGQKSFFFSRHAGSRAISTTSFSSLLRIKLEKYHRYHLNLNYRKTHFRNRFLFKKQREKKLSDRIHKKTSQIQIKNVAFGISKNYTFFSRFYSDIVPALCLSITQKVSKPRGGGPANCQTLAFLFNYQPICSFLATS